MEQKIDIGLAKKGLSKLERVLMDIQLSCAFWRAKDVVDAIEMLEEALYPENLSTSDGKLEKLKTTLASETLESLLERKVL